MSQNIGVLIDNLMRYSHDYGHISENAAVPLAEREDRRMKVRVASNELRAAIVKIGGVKFAYAIGDRVRVKAVDMGGAIDSLSLDNNGMMYRVVYWNNGDRHQSWMYDWEIEKAGG